ncbi:hypothetical protein GCM10010156_75570 [Planobispora rosea]|uniref:Uncharacterized protein n=1 Tax=Planobispora rosea TaxID=35762 RepID=A0A8J3S952_PLARO|nr:hypothetical protein [Planobispora rosea]GGT07171.1 hypothetical protein GCM10010156_75570 [Planobispora rosea]GIH89099.1 hypothetical protein Pro02_75070 [Planobispora rosea]
MSPVVPRFGALMIRQAGRVPARASKTIPIICGPAKPSRYGRRDGMADAHLAPIVGLTA